MTHAISRLASTPFDELVARFKKYSLLDHDTAVSMVLFIRGHGRFNLAWIDKLNCRMY